MHGGLNDRLHFFVERPITPTKSYWNGFTCRRRWREARAATWCGDTANGPRPRAARSTSRTSPARWSTKTTTKTTKMRTKLVVHVSNELDFFIYAVISPNAGNRLWFPSKVPSSTRRYTTLWLIVNLNMSRLGMQCRKFSVASIS